MEFTMVTPLGDSAPNGKENQPNIQSLSLAQNKMKAGKSIFLDKSKIKKGNTSPAESGEMNQAFDRLLDDLQIPSTLRPKLASMESSVKAAMLKSSQVLALGVAPASPPPTPRGMRRVHSGSSLSIESPRPQRASVDRYQTAGHAHGAALFDAVGSQTHHARGMSFDMPRPKSRAQGNTVFLDNVVASKPAKDKSTIKVMSSVQFVSILTGSSSIQLDVDIIKKLRLLLRNESASWSQDFLKLGGYSALLTRLNEILEVEWREEQHDDKILHELLRCLKALSTSSIGCFALRSSCPTPFVQLVSLLYSDKKPGDVATRQLIVDLLLVLFELYPPTALPSVGSLSRRDTWDRSASEMQPGQAISLPHPHKTLFSLLRAILLTPAPPSAEAPAVPVSPHEFIDALHRPRIYKTYLQELSDICRDYFWVFCHPNNALWNLADTDEAKVEKPRAPGGMTGGVEFEAMGYLTTHFRLINALAKAAIDLDLPMEHALSAYQLHVDLFLSGLERIVLIARKASATYYPTLHLELSRYIALAAEAHFELPWTVSRLIGPPPSAMCKRSAHGSPRSPTKRSGAPAAPVLPSPRRMDPIKFD